MPTRVERTVVYGGAGDYTSLSAWESNEVRDLTALDEIAVAICSTASGAEPNNITIDGWTTSYMHYIEIRTADSQWHQGRYTTGTYYRIAPSAAGNVIAIHADNVRLIHLEMSKGSQAADSAAIHFKAAEGFVADWRVEGCLVWRNAGNWTSGAGVTLADNNYGIKVQNAGYGSRLVVRNCCVHNYNHNGTAGDITPNGGICCDSPNTTVYALHNTLVDCGKGLVVQQGDMLAINNLIYCDTGDSPAQVACEGTFLNGTDYNATNLSSLGYTVTGGGNTHDRVSQTFTFTNTPLVGNNSAVTNNAMTITSGDAGARNQGRHLGGVLDFATDTDFLEKIRPASATPDIGWNEVEGVAGASFAARIEAGTWIYDINLNFLLTSAKIAYGEPIPGGDYDGEPWDGWTTPSDTPVPTSGHPSWGSLLLETGDIALSPVLDSGSTAQKNITLTMNQFGAGNSSFTLYIRGSASSFAQHDASPSWQEYTAPTQITWRYIQVRVVGA